ncbi:type III-B CRISPR-associated protein Cas10/Cmr2 [Undibacterium sp.]|uniref:type III-B CRISPR-associated protein Cas10/Cmr2 n=1 Tax=Undibacterium sp. TaxID=1914977 RepID=UPI0037527B25
MNSDNYLVGLAFGPVQSFIEAARRTRDLWAGSTLLSELSGHAGNTLKDKYSAELIFPSTLSLSATGNVGLTNKIVAVLRGNDPGIVLSEIGSTASALFQKKGDAFLSDLKAKGLEKSVDEALFRMQLSDAFDYHFAWVPMLEGGGYDQAFRRLQVLLDARKHTKTFLPVNDQALQAHTVDAYNRKIRAAAPLLSSLDGRRESVLTDARDTEYLRRRYQINEREELDAIGLIKRVGASAGGFPSVTRIAIEPWIVALSTQNQIDIGQLLDKLTPEKIGLVRRYSVPSSFVFTDAETAQTQTENNRLKVLAYDSEILLSSRRQQLPELDKQNPDVVELNQLLKTIGGPPDEGLYVCALMADGDHMGKLLQAEGITLNVHQKISEALAHFSSNCPALVARHGGACIYAGGDDVLALCSVDVALALARDLIDLFVDTLKHALKSDPGHEVPTLSVGLAFAHAMHPLGDLRRLAGLALHHAKQGPDNTGLRNALGILLEPRSGTRVILSGRWDESAEGMTLQGFDHRLKLWRDAFAEGYLSHSAGYDLAQLTRKLGPRALRSEAMRLFGRRLKGAAPAALSSILSSIASNERSAKAGLHQLSAEWYVARWLYMHAVATPVPALPSPKDCP